MLAERERQMKEEGYTPAHDDNHVHGEPAQQPRSMRFPTRLPSVANLY